MKNNFVSGTSHNSVIKAPDNVEDWVVYHGRSFRQRDRNRR